MARPKGTGKEYQVAKKLVEQKLLIEEKVSDDILDAYQVLSDTMKDKEASTNSRINCANRVVDLYNKFYKDRKGTAEITLDEFKAFDTKSKTDEGGRPLLSLKCTGTE